MFGQKTLRQFIAVAEELNFRRAAQRLHMTQPPLTQSIQRLEAQIGLQLFDRSQSRVSLTPAGAALLDEARLLLSQTDKAIETARRAESGLTSLLRVSFVPSVGQHLLPDIVLAFRRDNPAAHLELTAQTTSQQLEALRRGAIDLAIVVSPADRLASDGISYERLTRAGVCAAVPAGHPLAHRRRLQLAELANQPFVLMPAAHSPAFMGSIYAACSQAGFMPRVVQEASPIQAVLAMVACGVGVSLVPDAVRGEGRDTLRFIPLTRRPRLDYELSAAWLPGTETPVLKQFVALAKALGRLAGRGVRGEGEAG